MLSCSRFVQQHRAYYATTNLSYQHLRETQLLLCDTDGSQPLANSATSVSPLTALNLLNVMFLRADPALLKHGAAFRQFSAALASPPDDRPPPPSKPHPAAVASALAAESEVGKKAVLQRMVWRLAAIAAANATAQRCHPSPAPRRDSSASATAATAAIMYAKSGAALRYVTLCAWSSAMSARASF